MKRFGCVTLVDLYYHAFLYKIFVSTVPLLTDSEFTSLGVRTLGHRAILKKRCRDFTQSRLMTNQLYVLLNHDNR